MPSPRSARLLPLLSLLSLLSGSPAVARADDPKPAPPAPTAVPKADTPVPAKPEAKPAPKPEAKPAPKAEPKKPAKPEAPPPPVAAIPATPELLSGLSFDVPETVVELGRTHMLPFRAATAPAAVTAIPASASDPSILAIAKQGELADGFTIGFVRVRAEKLGEATLSVGSASQRVKVIPARSTLFTDLTRPRIVTPIDGACAWDQVTLGVTSLENPAWRHTGVIVLMQIDGRPDVELQPHQISDRVLGPTRRAVFDLNIAELESSGLTLPAIAAFTPVVTTRDGQRLAGETTRIRLLKPAQAPTPVTASTTPALGASEAPTPVPPPVPGQLMRFIAADQKDTERPKRFERGKILIGDDAKAFGGKGGRVVINNASDPPVCSVINVAEAGLYQVMLSVAGDFGLGALPAVGVVIDNSNQAITNGQIADVAWHRIALGVPFRLEPGQHTLAMRFENDAAAGNLGDRNLRIEQIELVRVSDLLGGAAAAAPAASDAGSMMDGSMMQMQAAPDKATKPDAAQAAKPDAAKPDAAKADGGGAMMSMMGETAADPAAQLDPADPARLAGPDPMGITVRRARVAWTTMFDGAVINGVTELEAQCSWQSPDRVPAPLTSLIINGREVARQRSAQPRFWVTPAQLKDGENRLKLISVASGGITLESLEQRLIKPAGFEGTPAGSVARYTMHDAAWGKAMADAVRVQNDARELRRAGLVGGVDYVLTLPAAMQGLQRLWLEARGATSKGLPKVTALLRMNGSDTPIGSATTRGGVALLDLGTIPLTGGPKQIVLRYDHKGYEAGSSEPGVFFESLILEPEPTSGEPAVAIAYPRADNVKLSSGAEGIVASVVAPAGIASAEALIDGRLTGQVIEFPRRAGLVYVPVSLRGVPPGEVTIALRVCDTRGRIGVSQPVTIRVVDQPGGPTTYELAVRAANRFAYGPDGATMSAILTKGIGNWLRDTLHDAANDSENAIASACVKFGNHYNEGDLANRYITQHTITSAPAASRLNVWVQNHFTTWVRKVESDRKWEEYQRLTGLGAAPMHDLLLTSATSPAMLLYLDQQNSYKGRLNENYAREIMELHTLGVTAGYTQADVTSMARLITGWITCRDGEPMQKNDRETRNQSFTFDPRLNEERPQTVFGVRFDQVEPGDRYDRALTAIEMLARHPKTASFIAKQLCEHYVDAPAPEALVAEVAKVFMRSGGDLAECVAAIAENPAVWQDWAPRLAHPLDFAVRMHRAVGGRNSGAVGGFLKRCRAGVFDCPTPDGYAAKDEPWADSNAMIQRFKFAKDAAGTIYNILPPAYRQASKPLTRDEEQAAMDWLAIRLMGLPLSERSNEAVWKVLDSMQATPQERLREMAGIVAAMPEANLR